MKRRWFLVGLALSAVSASCQPTNQTAESDDEGRLVKVQRNDKTLVVATSANYPPYEYFQSSELGETETGSTANSTTIETDGQTIIGFDIDLAGLIAERLGRKLSVVDVEFGALIPALVNDEVDMAIAALEPNRNRKQKVDFSNIYYRSRQSLISFEGYLRARDLNYQTIGIRAGSVQARFTERISAEYPDIDVIRYDTIAETFEALDEGLVEGIILESTVAKSYLRRYPDFEAQLLPSDRPMGSAIALPKNSPLRRDINAALTDIKTSGEMDQLIKKWFS
ncbi:MAG: ABC transporter substrate-binding protein [Phormidesmis sp.]